MYGGDFCLYGQDEIMDSVYPLAWTVKKGKKQQKKYTKQYFKTLDNSQQRLMILEKWETDEPSANQLNVLGEFPGHCACSGNQGRPTEPPHLGRQRWESKENMVAGINRTQLLKNREIHREKKALRSVEGLTTLVFNRVSIAMCVRKLPKAGGKRSRRTQRNSSQETMPVPRLLDWKNLLIHRNRVLIMSLTGLKIQVFSGLHSFLYALGKDLFPCPFQLLEATTFLGSWPSFLHLESKQCQAESSSHCHLSGSHFLFPLAFSRTLVIALVPPK